ncbi:MAG: hypothetical protein M3R65_10280 [Gemmatimonadota bacterium]|nr:hypothetical protein [Gemmatimonadota bacterium]
MLTLSGTFAPVATPIAMLMLPASGHAQQMSERDHWADSVRVEIAAGVESESVQRIKNAQAIAERALTAFPDDALLLHYSGYAMYREASLMLGTPDQHQSQRRQEQQRQEAKALFDSGMAVLKRSAAKVPLPETYALESAIAGGLIAINPSPINAMEMGLQSGTKMDRALEVGPSNPRVWLVRGIGAFYTPSMWGGGMDRAEEYLTKAKTLFANDHPSAPLPAWGAAETEIWLGMVYTQKKRLIAARAAFQRALAIDPGSAWAKAMLATNVSTNASATDP